MRSMFSRHRTVLAITLALATPLTQAQSVFFEDFTDEAIAPCNPAAAGGFTAGTYPFPANWLLRNVDNRPPNAAVAYVNAAWRVREDFITPELTNCVAFSTSWTSPVGVADDWMWTPLINLPVGQLELAWRALAPDDSYRDGYEVRVMTAADGPPTGGAGVLGNQVSSSVQVFSIAAEASSWTQQRVPLTSFSGQSVYVGFRNNSNNMFLLLIDDVAVNLAVPNLAATAPVPTTPYTRVPTGVAYVPDLGVRASNAGSVVLNNVLGSATLKRNTTPLSVSNATGIPQLAIGANPLLVFPTALNAMTGDGNWSIEYQLEAAEAGLESTLADNTISSAATLVGGNELSRFEGDPVSGLGIGAGNGGEFGVQFTLPTATRIEGIRFALAEHPLDPMNPDIWPGLPIVAQLRSFNTGTGKPGPIIATTTAGITERAATNYGLPFAGGPQLLQPGTYVATIEEPVGATSMSLLVHLGRFQPGNVWVNWPTIPSGDWSNIETFGAAFERMPQISLLTSMEMFRDGFEQSAAPGMELTQDAAAIDAVQRERTGPLPVHALSAPHK